MDIRENRNFPDALQVGFGYFRFILDEHNQLIDYEFLDINSTFETMMGLRREDILGKYASEVYRISRNDDRFDWQSYYASVVRSGKTQETIQWIERFGRYYKVTVVPSSEVHFALMVRDATDEALRPNPINDHESVIEGLDTLFNRTHDAMLLIGYRDGEFRFLINNAIHKRLTGFSNIKNTTPVELVGEEIGQKLIRYYQRCISTGLAVVYEQNYDFAPGKRIWHTEITPILGRDGLTYLLSSSKDITELKVVQNENEVLAMRLQSMFTHHTAIMLIIEPDTGKIIDANPAACSFYGYTKEELQHLYIQDINMLPPDTVIEMSMKAYYKQQSYFIFPHRLKNGDVRLVDVYSCPISSKENVQLYSIIFDVTDRETYRDQLFEEKEVLRTTLQSIGDGVVTTDSCGMITSLNTIAQVITGWSDHEAKGRKFSEVFLLQNEDTGASIENPIQRVLDTGLIVGLANHTVLINRNDQVIPIADSAAPIKAEDGEILGVVMVFRDVSTEKEQNDRIRFLSYHDPLTKLYNRRYVEETMQTLDTPDNLPIAVVMGDVNGLKITNDVFGHTAGDTLLINMAGSLQRHCRKQDIIARWGGDEVLIFMPRTTLAEAEAIVEQIKQDSIHIDNKGLHMSISFGCAMKEKPDDNIQKIMREAEEYMYHQKLLDGKSYRNAIINTLLATLYEKSNETEEHSKRMERHCHLIGRKLQLSSKEMDELSLLAILHDIGKVSVNPNILQKAGPLTSAEWIEMKRHTEIGYRIAQTTPELAAVADFILAHHERWDGKGYPRKLKGDAIPLPCRILAVTDAFDAMTNDRVYRNAIDTEAAIAEIKQNAGTQFDPAIVNLFVEIVLGEK